MPAKKTPKKSGIPKFIQPADRIVTTVERTERFAVNRYVLAQRALDSININKHIVAFQDFAERVVLKEGVDGHITQDQLPRYRDSLAARKVLLDKLVPNLSAHQVGIDQNVTVNLNFNKAPKPPPTKAEIEEQRIIEGERSGPKTV